MTEPRCELPLHHYLQTSNPSASDAGVTLTERARKGHLVLRGDAAAPDFLSACQSVLGLELPRSVRGSSTAGGNSAYWLGPEEWLLIVDAGEEWGIELRLREAYRGHCSIVDVSGGQTVLNIRGTGVAELLQKSCGYDFSADQFARGECVQTNFAKATALVIKHEDTSFDLVVRRSFSDYIYAWIADASAEYGFVAKGE